MYNHMLTKIACGAVFRMAFAAGVCIGGICGVALGILERSAVGIFGGAFLGLAVGLGAGALAFAGAVVFNLLVPYLGGVAVWLDPVPAVPPDPAEPPGQQPAD
ncbi:MAG: hypothetical protein RIN56_16435 [Sporomusaceae bacterium]|nr:hypothetical protein [Sporomusaceae bacterium]